MFKLPAQKKYLGKIKLLKNKQALFDKIYSPLKLGVLLQNKFTLFNFRKSINTKNFKIFMQFKILCYAEPIDAVKSLKKGAYLSQKLTTLDANLITNQHFLLIIIFYARSRLLGFQFILIFRNFGDNQVLEDGMMCTCSRNGNQCKI